MLEDHLKLLSRSTYRRLREGPAGVHVEAFVESLLAEGYSPITVSQTCYFLAALTDWVARNGFGDDLGAGLSGYTALAPQGRLRGSSTARRVRGAGKRYLQFLRPQGMDGYPWPRSRTGALRQRDRKSDDPCWLRVRPRQTCRPCGHGLSDSEGPKRIASWPGSAVAIAAW
jgi:hypothetical protein